MARNIDSKRGMTEGLFSTDRNKERYSADEDVLEKSSAQKKETKQEEIKENTKKVGRPRDGDLQENEEIKSTTIQLTDETIYKIDAYLLDHKPKSRSQVIRELIRKHF